MCHDVKIEMQLLPGHGFSILSHTSFMWAKVALDLTHSCPSGSLASALSQPCGMMVWADVPQDTAGRGLTSAQC